MQLDFLRKVCETLDEEHQDIQNRILQVLVSKLQAAIFQLERVRKKIDGKHCGNHDNVVKVKRFKYIWIKECVDNAIKDLEEWQKKFDPSWFLIMKVVNPIIDQELAKGKTEVASISTAKGLRDSLKVEPRSRLPYSSLRTNFCLQIGTKYLSLPHKLCRELHPANVSYWTQLRATLRVTSLS